MITFKYGKGERQTLTVGELILALCEHSPSMPVMIAWEGQVIAIEKSDVSVVNFSQGDWTPRGSVVVIDADD